MLQSWLLTLLCYAAVATATAIKERANAVVLSLNVTTPTQCGTSVVRWSGDDGPYQLLLTPTKTTFASHGYNDWIESIPAGTSSYNLTIRQPAGLQFLLTMWGKSGILSAGTTDVMTVGPSALTPEDTSCFLSDQDILNRYAFSFNATSSDPSFPPQCSNITLSWPTSLESNVTAGSLERRQSAEVASVGSIITQGNVGDADYNDLGTSSSTKTGNTTDPPTIFGIIPLGNSFSVPVTYSSKSNLAETLPESSISDNPTTKTRNGVTSLNFTVAMTKGTRFVLVMGIGSQQDWASGGSSSLMTVGQGSFGCFFQSPGDVGDTTSIPSITATTTKGPVETDGDGQVAQPVSSSKRVSTVAIVLASIFSVIATLLAVCLCCGVYRLRKRRKARRENAAAGGKAIDDDYKSSPKSISFLGLGLGRKLKGKEASRYESSETPMDILGPLAMTRSHSSSRLTSPTDRSALDPQGHYGHASPRAMSLPASPIIGHGQNPFRDPGDKIPFAPRAGGPSRETTMSSSNDTRSPTSPLAGRPAVPWRADSEEPSDWGMGEQAPVRTLTPLREYEPLGAGALALSPAPRGPLVLHNAEPALLAGDQEEEDEPETELKRDTLAFLGSPTSATGPSAARPTPPRRRPRRDEAETRYVVHRDAGRVRPPPAEERVLELPPRYEEMDWENEQEREARVAEEREPGSPTDGPRT